LQQERRFADAWVAADEQRRARDETAATNTIELGDAGEEARGRRRIVAAAGGAGIALVLTPLVPAGLPILAAGAAAVAASRMRRL